MRAILRSRAVIDVKGPDAAPFLHNIVTQSTLDRAPGDVAYGALLTPQGKIVADFLLTRTDAGFLMDVHAAAAAALLKKLAVYRLRAAVESVPRPDLLVAALWGDEAGAEGAPDPRSPALGRRMIIDAADAAALHALEDDASYRRLRYAVGAPEIGDFEPETLFAADANFDALAGVDYKKGCFVGQEVTSRMKRKGEIRKRTLIISRRDGPLPGRETALVADGVELGRILAADGDIGLALVRLDRLAAAASTPVRAENAPVHLAIPSYLEEG